METGGLQFTGPNLLKDPRHRGRILLIGVLALVTLGANLAGILLGFTVVLTHLLYFPVILAAYWYPRRGLLFSVLITVLYGIFIFIFATPATSIDLISLSRMAILILVGGVVSFLSKNLAQSEQQLHDIIEFLPDATFAIDREGRVIAWNRAVEELTGVKKAAVLGQGDYAYALAFYHERRPMLAGLIISGEEKPAEKYPEVRREAPGLVSEVFLPHLHGGRGAHIRFSATALVDAHGTITGAIESIRDITDRVMTEKALEKTSNQLNTQAGILRHDMARQLSVLYGHLRLGVMKFRDPEVISFISELKKAANGIMHQIEISRDYRDIGVTPPAWIPVQDAFLSAANRIDLGNVSFHPWTGRLLVFCDPHLPTVFFHLLHNALKEEVGATKIIATYQVTDLGCVIIIEDNGTGVPDNQKARLFEKREDSFGRGLFLSGEILSITGISMRETGVYGKGARFEILIPSEGYRIAGMTQ
ncbi:MAG: PAS domain S-box protein [Methanomicrobiales archaeon]|nr:PAS domain S-box protein [Methanomicrobiales archaeon]